MSTFKVNFEITKADADLLISSLSHVAQNTASSKRKKILLKIIREIKFDHKLDSIIFNELVLPLQPMSHAPIRINSHLDNNLRISKSWLRDSLHHICNHVVLILLRMSKSKKKAKAITPTMAMKSKTIKDVMKLIRSRYENAK